ncbi:MAG: glycosyltransferase family 39 protein [Pseudomonadota bacterium]
MNSFASSPRAPYIFFAIYALAWTITATLSDVSYHFDIQEEIAWGKEWLIGLYRHPPMKVWLLEIANQATGFAEFTPYLLSTVLFGVGQVAIYWMLADVVSRRLAFFAVMSTTAVYLFGSQLPLWNANTVQFPFVGLFVLSVWRALDRRSPGWLVAAAVFAACGVLGKYSYFLIIAPVALWALVVPELRQRIAWRGLIIAIAVFAMLLAPNAFWFLTEGEPARQFIANRTSETYHGVLGALLAAGEIVLIFIGLILAPALFGLFGLTAGDRLGEAELRLRRLLHVLGAAAVGSHLLILVVVLVTGTVVKDHWLMASLLTVPPFLVVFMHRHRQDVTLNRIGAVFCAAWLVGILAAYPLERYVKLEGRPNGKPFAWFPVMPSQPLVDKATNFWTDLPSKAGQTGFPDGPAFIAGGTVAALVANNYPGRPSWLEGFSPALSPWVSVQDIQSKPFLSIGPVPTSFLERHDLCVVYHRRTMWKNIRGEDAREINFHAVAPQTYCEKTG